MATREQILNYVSNRTKVEKQNPIFDILLFEHEYKEKIYHTTKGYKPSGFPDLGSSADVGFYHDLDDAIQAMHENSCDIRECVYNAGFVLCRFPGLYQCAGSDLRMYFTWNDEKGGFFEAEEPKIFEHIAY